MDKILSISVAAYNVANYLDQLMQSVIASGVIDDLEVLVVNDGSKDETASKALEYQDLYPQSVRLIDKENGGHGSTINRGIVEATGKYFRALDGDDWIHSEHLRKLVAKMKNIESDIILSNYCKCFEDGREELGHDFDKLEDNHEYSFEEITEKVDWMRYHTVIYKTTILKEHQIHLDEHCFYVDAEFMILPIPYVKTVYYSEDYIYCYRLGLTEQSVSPESRMKHVDNSLTVARRLIDFWRDIKATLSEPHKKYIESGIIGHCMWHINSIYMFPLNAGKKNDLIQFDKYLKANAPDLYQLIGEKSKVLTALRLSGYCLYPVARKYRNTKMSR